MREKQRLFSEEEIRGLMSQVLQGLSYMHRNGYFHRDLKPGIYLLLSVFWWHFLSQHFDLLHGFTADSNYPITFLPPENLLVTRDISKIADFGLAREVSSLPPFTEYVSTRWWVIFAITRTFSIMRSYLSWLMRNDVVFQGTVHQRFCCNPHPTLLPLVSNNDIK